MASKGDEVWKSYTRGVKAGAKRRGRDKTPLPLAREKDGVVRQVPISIIKHRSYGASLPPTPAREGWENFFLPLDRTREKKLRQGDITIDARLDLHGMTQDEAFAALQLFMRDKTAAGKRILLIITGKGRGGAGVLRGNLEGWLRQLPEAKRILALRPAAVQHGGDGAFYVVMRKL